MKTIARTLATAAIFAGSTCVAGELFLQMRVEKTRCGVPCRYDYRTSTKTQSVQTASVISEPAITTGPVSSTPRLQFVFDDVESGPVTLKHLSATTDGNGGIRVSGILNHTGGATGQLQGGKVVLRVEPLTNVNTTTKTGTLLAEGKTELWVRRNEPETVHVDVQYASHYPGGFGDVQRVRLFLEYQPNR
ncbi:MAG: hypothetical protein U0996_25735 [Planctomycetaceae bacterium]